MPLILFLRFPDSVQVVYKIHQLLPSMPTGVLTSKTADLTDAKLKAFSGYAKYVNANLKNVAADPTLVPRIHVSIVLFSEHSRESLSQSRPRQPLKAEALHRGSGRSMA